MQFIKNTLKDHLRPPYDGEGSTALSSRVSLQESYRTQLAVKNWQSDPAQSQTVDKLQTILDCLVTCPGRKKRQSSWSFYKSPKPNILCQGIYIHGGVGCGKSMLMDLFFEACPIEQKKRAHFHEFMQQVHLSMFRLRKSKSPNAIQQLAREIRLECQVFCFDEFHVTDIADAMILGRLFGELFQLGLVLVATSNRHPDDLYQGGLQREKFIEFVDLLKGSVTIHRLDSPTDYRSLHEQTLNDYFFPLGMQADAFIDEHFRRLSNNTQQQSVTLHVQGRQLTIAAASQKLARMSFDDLCARPLGAADYQAICDYFDTLLLTDIPQFKPEHRNEVKRFVTLIDILYERRIRLIISAAVASEQLYPEGDGKFEFARTISRLNEMQSLTYRQKK